MLIAEDFVLLALDPAGTPARGMSSQAPSETGVIGALVTELAIDGHLRVEDDRIVLTGTRPTDPLLAQVLDNTAIHAGKKLRSRLGQIKHSGWSEVVDRMVTNGLLGREKRTLQATHHPVLVPGQQAALLEHLRATARGSGPMDLRTSVLLALAGPCQLLEIVAPNPADHKQAKARIAEATEHAPAAGAVKAVIDATNAAVIAIVTTVIITT